MPHDKNDTAAASPLVLEQLAGKVESLASLMGEFLTTRFSTLEVKLEHLRETLSQHKKEHLLVAEVAELTGRSSYTVRRWISEGRLKAIRIRDGGHCGILLIPRAELERLVSGGKGAGIPDVVLG